MRSRTAAVADGFGREALDVSSAGAQLVGAGALASTSFFAVALARGTGSALHDRMSVPMIGILV